jgi:hypothetical protein
LNESLKYSPLTKENPLMLQRKQNGPFLITAFGCLVALLVGCSASTGTLITGTSPDFTGASTATGSEVSASVGSMTMVQSSQSAGALANIQHSVHPDDAKGIGDGCGTVVVNSTNGQGAVTDETITYALPACEFTGIRGLDSLAITGDLELTQPDPPAFSFSSKATSLEFAFTASGLTSSETRNGTRQLTATQNILNESNDMTTVFQKASAGVGTLNNSLAFSFTPAAGQPWPSAHHCPAERWKRMAPSSGPPRQPAPPPRASPFPPSPPSPTIQPASPPPPAPSIPAS